MALPRTSRKIRWERRELEREVGRFTCVDCGQLRTFETCKNCVILSLARQGREYKRYAVRSIEGTATEVTSAQGSSIDFVVRDDADLEGFSGGEETYQDEIAEDEEDVEIEEVHNLESQQDKGQDEPRHRMELERGAGNSNEDEAILNDHETVLSKLQDDIQDDIQEDVQRASAKSTRYKEQLRVRMTGGPSVCFHSKSRKDPTVAHGRAVSLKCSLEKAEQISDLREPELQAPLIDNPSSARDRDTTSLFIRNFGSSSRSPVHSHEKLALRTAEATRRTVKSWIASYKTEADRLPEPSSPLSRGLAVKACGLDHESSTREPACPATGHRNAEHETCVDERLNAIRKNRLAKAEAQKENQTRAAKDVDTKINTIVAKRAGIRRQREDLAKSEALLTAREQELTRLKERYDQEALAIASKVNGLKRKLEISACKKLT
ncbi:MAG: hypothetical protein M1827_002224 [Pycnora praestabilis]|nr:MAG: hypothetical protein M1827_002224 [Pycnora praestabilis]